MKPQLKLSFVARKRSLLSYINESSHVQLASWLDSFPVLIVT